MLVTALYNTADTFFVSRLGTSASGAVGIVFFNNGDIPAIGLTFGTGAASMISRKLGAHETDSSQHIRVDILFPAFAGSSFFTVFGLFALDDFMIRLGSTDTILPYATIPRVHPSWSSDNVLILCNEQHTESRGQGGSGNGRPCSRGCSISCLTRYLFLPSASAYQGSYSNADIPGLHQLSILLSVFITRKSTIRIRIYNISKKTQRVL